MSAIKRWFGHLKARVFANGLVKFLVRVFSEFGFDDGTNMAAALSYYAFLNIFPLLIALIGALGLFLPANQALQDQVFAFFQQNLPGAASVLQDNVQSIISLRGTLGVIGIATLLITGSSLFAAIAHTVNRAWDVRTELSFLPKKLRDLGMTVVLGVLFLLSLAVSGFVATPLQSIPLAGSALVQVGGRALSLLFSFAIFLLLFKVAPNTKTWWRFLWHGALFTAILFEVGRNLAFIYLTRFTNYRMVYGAVASIVVLLIWMYYSALIVIIGAEFTAEYGRFRRGIPRGLRSHSLAQPKNA